MFCNGCFPWHSGNVSLNANQIFFISKPLCPELPSLMCHIIVKLSLKRSTLFFAISYVNMEPCLLQENHRLPFLTILFYLYGFGYKSLLRSIYCSDLQRADWNCLTGCEALALTFSSNHLEEILIGWQKKRSISANKHRTTGCTLSRDVTCKCCIQRNISRAFSKAQSIKKSVSAS